MSEQCGEASSRSRMRERGNAWLRIGIQRIRTIDGKENLDSTFFGECLEVFVK